MNRLISWSELARPISRRAAVVMLSRQFYWASLILSVNVCYISCRNDGNDRFLGGSVGWRSMYLDVHGRHRGSPFAVYEVRAALTENARDSGALIDSNRQYSLRGPATSQTISAIGKGADTITLLMANRFGIPPDIEYKLRARDQRCVYCRRAMKPYPRTHGTPADKATIEHLDHRPPFYWGEGLERSGIEGIALCCGACNSSRGKKRLATWFASAYCEQRDINARTVAPVVKRYLRLHSSSA